MGRPTRRRITLAFGTVAIAFAASWLVCADTPWAAEAPNELAWPSDATGAEEIPVEVAMPADSVVTSSPLFCHPHPDDPLRHRNKGAPLTGTSWRNRPLYAGWFVGGLFGDSPVGGELEQGEGLFGGYRLGCDFDHYWGVETRFGFANLDIFDKDRSEVVGVAGNWFCDGSLLYYPWGDSRWRPYTTLGLGLAGYEYLNDHGRQLETTVVGMPFGLGLKYYHRSWLALRASAMDNLTFGNSGVRTMNNFSLTAGVEVHWGGSSVNYFPWSSAGLFW